MELDGRAVLITGGATGIGFALAERFVSAGSEVMVCGRRVSRLRMAKRKLPALHIKRCDVSLESERRNLVRWSFARFPKLGILVNNAGIQRQMDFTSPSVSKLPSNKDDEVGVNLTAYIRLCALFAPKFIRKDQAGIVNVSSGLGFVPIASMPVYCATKAAIHSFTTSLRHQLRNTSVRVFEAVPPTTDTELDAGFAGEEEQEHRGISPEKVAEEIIEGLKAGKEEILVGEAQGLYQAALKDPEGIFEKLNSW
jgi:uncharacterized oxidoreductase